VDAEITGDGRDRPSRLEHKPNAAVEQLLRVELRGRLDPPRRADRLPGRARLDAPVAGGLTPSDSGWSRRAWRSKRSARQPAPRLRPAGSGVSVFQGRAGRLFAAKPTIEYRTPAKAKSTDSLLLPGIGRQTRYPVATAENRGSGVWTLTDGWAWRAPQHAFTGREKEPTCIAKSSSDTTAPGARDVLALAAALRGTVRARPDLAWRRAYAKAKSRRVTASTRALVAGRKRTPPKQGPDSRRSIRMPGNPTRGTL
jgi:hypothetical protein